MRSSRTVDAQLRTPTESRPLLGQVSLGALGPSCVASAVATPSRSNWPQPAIPWLRNEEQPTQSVQRYGFFSSWWSNDLGVHVGGPCHRFLTLRANLLEHGRATWQRACGRQRLALICVASCEVSSVHLDPPDASCRHGPISTTGPCTRTSRPWNSSSTDPAPVNDLSCANQPLKPDRVT